METKQKEYLLVILLIMINIATGMISFAMGIEEGAYNCECDTLEIHGPCPNQIRNITKFEEYVGGSTIEEVRHNSQISVLQ